jgi:hypothetical protein
MASEEEKQHQTGQNLSGYLTLSQQKVLPGPRNSFVISRDSAEDSHVTLDSHYIIICNSESINGPFDPSPHAGDRDLVGLRKGCHAGCPRLNVEYSAKH